MTQNASPEYTTIFGELHLDRDLAPIATDEVAKWLIQHGKGVPQLLAVGQSRVVWDLHDGTVARVSPAWYEPNPLTCRFEFKPTRSEPIYRKSDKIATIEVLPLVRLSTSLEAAHLQSCCLEEGLRWYHASPDNAGVTSEGRVGFFGGYVGRHPDHGRSPRFYYVTSDSGEFESLIGVTGRGNGRSFFRRGESPPHHWEVDEEIANLFEPTLGTTRVVPHGYHRSPEISGAPPDKRLMLREQFDFSPHNLQAAARSLS